MIFCACQLQEKAREQQKPLYLIFYDLEKAFDCVPRDAMWAVLKCFGLPDQIIAMIRALHDGMAARVIHQGDMSEEFPVTCGLKQGCVLAPTRFSFYLAAMLHDIPQDNPGVEIKYRLEGGLFNLSRLRSLCHTRIITVNELQYADDNACPAHSHEEIQHLVHNYSNACATYGMSINKNKTSS